MKRILVLCLGLFSTLSFAANSPIVVKLMCETMNDYRSIDINDCLLRGAQAYDSGKLALAQELCLKQQLKIQGKSGRHQTIQCMNVLLQSQMPDDGELDKRVESCSRFRKNFEAVARVLARKAADVDYESRYGAQAMIYACVESY